MGKRTNSVWRPRGPLLLCLGLLASCSTQAIWAQAPVGTEAFVDRRNPPPYRALSAAEFKRFDLGLAVFNTQFVVAGTPGAGRRDGVGPMFNAASCDQCHNDGARGVGPIEDGPAPAALVIQLAAPSSPGQTDPEGDPVYGRVFNTVALEGVPPEGVALIRYAVSEGHYADGTAWSLRVPHYELSGLHYGPLSPRTIVKPRLAPALFGVGLLEAAAVGPDSIVAAPGGDAGASGVHALPVAHTRGLFGWQATALSIRDQSARAFSREMGITSTDFDKDDCTTAEAECLRQPNGGSPEVSAEFLDAVVSFQSWLAVPASPAPHTAPDSDSKIFSDLGCVACHRPQLRAQVSDASGKKVAAVIAPYTDLRLHDLGPRLADEDVSGAKIPSRWRTAPLWGLGYRLSREHHPTFLHDGRARSAEEAILWHDGEAMSARRNFEQLPALRRKALLHWLETL